MLLKKNIVRRYAPFLFLFILFLNINTSVSFSASGPNPGFETAKGHFKRGLVYFNRMQYLPAVEFFRKAVSEYPEYYTSREYLARAYKLAGFINEAVREWENLADITANNVSVMNKVDTLRYRISSAEQEKLLIGPAEFVFSDAYNTADMGRYRFPNPVDIAVDGEKNIYVTSFATGKLVKLDPNGDGLSVFSRGTGTRFYGVDCYKEKVCVSDFKTDAVHILDRDLDMEKSFGKSGLSGGEFHGPKGIAFDDKGNIYVADSGNSRVQKFDNEGNYILKFGEPGEYEGQLNNPSDIYIDKDTVYVTDTGNKRIACFDDSGNFIKNIIIEDCENPRGIFVYGNNIAVSDEKKGLIFYSMENGSSSRFASWNKAKKRFSRLVASGIDRDGLLYCLDYDQESVFIFSPIQSVYSNLDVEITSVDASRYPTVGYYLNVRNRDGKPVYNLENSNFKISEDDAAVANLSVNFLKNGSPSMSAVLCVDRSNENSGYHNDIPWISDFILKKMKKNDSIQLINYNRDSWVGNDFDWSRLRTVQSLKKRNYSSGKAIDKALYNAISNLIPKLNRRGVILISDGTVASDSFGRYTPENIIEYAKSHYIPIYIIVFKSKDLLLKRIAEGTGGAIYKATELDGLRSIYDRIRQAEEYRYIAIYTTLKTPYVKDWWSDVKIEINYKGRRGVDWCGYFVP